MMKIPNPRDIVVVVEYRRHVRGRVVVIGDGDRRRLGKGGMPVYGGFERVMVAERHFLGRKSPLRF